MELLAAAVLVTGTVRWAMQLLPARGETNQPAAALAALAPTAAVAAAAVVAVAVAAAVVVVVAVAVAATVAVRFQWKEEWKGLAPALGRLCRAKALRRWLLWAERGL